MIKLYSWVVKDKTLKQGTDGCHSACITGISAHLTNMTTFKNTHLEISILIYLF